MSKKLMSPATKRKFEEYFNCKGKTLVYIIEKARYELWKKNGTVIEVSDLFAEQKMGIFDHVCYHRSWRIA